MGQKVHPTAYRLALTKNWKSRWFTADDKKFSTLLVEDVKIRRMIMIKLKQAGVSSVVIERSAGKINIIVSVSRPGMVIGRGGAGVEELRKTVEAQIGQKVALNIEEIRNPDLDAYLVARNMADQIERRFPVKRAINQTADRVMRAGALGVKILVSGRLGGAEIARKEKEVRGSIPTATLRAKIDFAAVDAKTATAGVTGIKIWIHKKEEAKT